MIGSSALVRARGSCSSLSSPRRWRRWPRRSRSRHDSAGTGARSHAADRSGGAHRPTAERAPLFPAPEQPARKARVDAAGGERRRDPGGSRPARPGALPRAHGVQRHRALQAGRAGVVPRIDRRAVWPARQRVDLVRRNHLHARHADRQARLRREGACWCCTISPPAFRCCPRKSRRNAASCSKSGAAASAPARA